MKKIMNSPETYVLDALQGMVCANKQLALDADHCVVYRCQQGKKVGLLSGGGSGHEPAHAGYVGYGMLDAAVAGNVFASPSAEHVYYGIRAVNKGEGVLMIIKNYSGDVMNFTMAQELAEMDGIQTDYVVVKDDVAVPDSTYSTGRRGIAGTVFVHKLAGAKAEAGGTLQEVKAVAEKTIDRIRSIGMSFSPCILPGVGKPGFELAPDEMELGMGIHGEPGVNKCKIMTAQALASVMLEKIMTDKDFRNSDVALMVNGLGATPISELYILNKEAHALLQKEGVQVYKTFVGNYMTSLEMAGASITLLELDDELKTLLDAPCKTMALQV